MHPIAETPETEVDPIEAVLFEDERALHDQVKDFLAFASRHEPGLAARFRPIMNVSGKRIRPLLPFWLQRAFANEQAPARREAVARVAAVTLVLHSAAIVIDDIEDESVERQGQAALHLRFGLGPTLNSASLLIFAALEYLGGDAELLALNVHSISRCHEGQALDLAFGDPAIAAALFAGSSEDRASRWTTCTRFKTSQLMELSVRAAAHVLDLSKEMTEQLASAIVGYGIAYQMLDDVKNFRPDLLGDKAYEDLPRGLRNWVVLELLSGLSPPDLAHASRLYGSDSFSSFVRMHPDLPKAKAQAMAAARAQIAAVERTLCELTGERSCGYIARLLGRPLEDLLAVMADD